MFTTTVRQPSPVEIVSAIDSSTSSSSRSSRTRFAISSSGFRRASDGDALPLSRTRGNAMGAPDGWNIDERRNPAEGRAPHIAGGAAPRITRKGDPLGEQLLEPVRVVE